MTTDPTGNAALQAQPAPQTEDGATGLPVDAQSLLTAFDRSQTVGICVLNRHHRLVHVNQTFARLIGRLPEGLLGERLASFLEASSLDEARDTLNAVMRGPGSGVNQWRLLDPAGKPVDLRIESWFVDGRFGRPYLLVMAQPISTLEAKPDPDPEEEARPEAAAQATSAGEPTAPQQTGAAAQDAPAAAGETVTSAKAAVKRLAGPNAELVAAAIRSRETTLASGRERFMHAILKAMPDTVFVLDKAGRIGTVWSPGPMVAGIPVKKINGLRFGQLFRTADALRVRDALRDTRTKRRPRTITVQFTQRLGAAARGYMELRFSVLPQGGMLAVMRDVTAQRRSRLLLNRQVENLDGMRRTFIDRGRQLTRLADRLSREKRRSDRIKATRTHFLATVSHEFRTPLNAILGFAEILNSELLGPLGNPRYRRYARDIMESGNLLLSLVDTVMSYEQAATDRLTIEPDRVDLPAVINEVTGLFGRWAGSLGISLEVDSPSTDPILYADAKALRQMMANLISNAVKFSGSGSVVRIRTGPGAQGKGTIIAVEDHGIGMSEEEIGLSLRPFGQVAEHPSGGRSGIGIGLPLTRHLIEEHGGRLHIKSKPGVGTTVNLIFPPSSAMLPPQAKD